MTKARFISLKRGSPGRARLVYAGLLLGLLVPGLNLVAVVLAYLGRGTGDGVLESHAVNQIHIFWKSAAYVLIGVVLTYFLIGVLVLMAAIVWYILRIFRGWKTLSANEAPANPASWLL
jgi:uncharacterized membrane protein